MPVIRDQAERHFGCRFSDQFSYRGLRLGIFENEIIRVTVVLDKGTDVVGFLHKPTDTDFLWRSPRGLRSPVTYPPSLEQPRGMYTDFYEGGWQEVFPHGGSPSQYKGALLGLHGEAWCLPWEHEVVVDTPECVEVRCWTRMVRTPWLLMKTLRIESGKPVLFIEETATNEGREPADFMWGHHPAFGAPFLSGECVLDVPGRRVLADTVEDSLSRFAGGYDGPWPHCEDRRGNAVDASRILSPDAGFSDMLFVTELDQGWYGLTNTATGVGFGMGWDLNLFRHVWYWQQYGNCSGFPWYGRGYVVAVEPFSSRIPTLAATIDGGQQITAAPGEAVSTWLVAAAYTGLSRVTGISRDGAVVGEP